MITISAMYSYLVAVVLDASHTKVVTVIQVDQRKGPKIVGLSYFLILCTLRGSMAHCKVCTRLVLHASIMPDLQMLRCFDILSLRHGLHWLIHPSPVRRLGICKWPGISASDSCQCIVQNVRINGQHE